MHLGERLKKLREKHGDTQTELAVKIGYSFGSISNIERSGHASFHTVKLICDHYKIEPEWLVAGDGPTPDGVIVPIRKEIEESPWKDAAFQTLREENLRLWKIVEHLTGGKAATFLKALSKASTTGKQVHMHNVTGVLLGVQA